MAQVIWKYKLPMYQTVLHIPEGSRVLSAAGQENDIYIWILNDNGNDEGTRTVDRKFNVYPTGHEVYEDVNTLVFIGTAQLNNGLVYHVFEDVS